MKKYPEFQFRHFTSIQFLESIVHLILTPINRILTVNWYTDGFNSDGRDIWVHELRWQGQMGPGTQMAGPNGSRNSDGRVNWVQELRWQGQLGPLTQMAGPTGSMNSDSRTNWVHKLRWQGQLCP